MEEAVKISEPVEILYYTPFGIRLLPIIIVLSVFTISLAIGAYVRRNRIPEGDRRKDF